MFKDLKISTGINILFGLLIACIILVSAYSLTSARSSADNFDDAVMTNENIDMLNSSIVGITGAVAQINAGMLATMINQPIEQSDIDRAKTMLSNAEKQMDKFISTPFQTDEETTIAADIKKRFDIVMASAQRKITFIKNPTAYDRDVVDEAKQRVALQEASEQYLVFAEHLITNFSETSHNDTQRMTFFAFFALALAIISAVGSRIWLKRTIFNRLQQAVVSFQAIAGGNLSNKIDIGAQNEIGQMLQEVEHMRQSLTDTVYGIRNGVKQIYSNAQEIATSNNDLSSRTEQQASALQETAASMEELKITVRQNADNAHSAQQLAESASASAQKGGEVMINLDKIMTEITANSRQIADINSVIDSIANQTNILALNAAVEAARAGEQGRGFAVVAGEVRNLAKRSADAAKEIRQLINTCVANMNIGSQEVELAGSSMQEIVKSVIQVTDIMAEITSASDEQSTGINQIAQAVNEMDLVTQQNASMVENAARTATSVEEHASDLEQIVAQFVVNESHVSVVTRERNNSEKLRPVITTAKRDYVPAKKSEGDWETF
ncbi:methyl-accepting chemotaxis protein [Kosakonia pseudosacchari]|uniref:methyl-accepting chemotaxis protein n=1 Tax=Kosakonia pseudosacchari TaxID=1646340 RepID=UPI001881C7FF|nr:methyl-accepting chemotaxis protein [Kosakonia pseudosacchari]QOV63046.1 Tar ligand binding domain-containing protein [Kosakonia pseudosacchari]